MGEFFAILLIAALCFLFAAQMFYWFCVHRLVEFEYTNYYEFWLEDGKPIGGFGTVGKSRESSFWAGSWAREACIGKWLTETPDWIERDLRALDRLNKLRRAHKVMWFSVYVIGAVFFVTLFFRYEDWI